MPDPSGGVGTTWSQVSGPGAVVLDDAGAVDATAALSGGRAICTTVNGR